MTTTTRVPHRSSHVSRTGALTASPNVVLHLAGQVAALDYRDCRVIHTPHSLVRQFQTAKGGLKADGLLGPRTYAALADVLWNWPGIDRPMAICVEKRYGLPAIKRAWLEYNNPQTYGKQRTGRGGSSSQSRTGHRTGFCSSCERMRVAGFGDYNCGSNPCTRQPPPQMTGAAGNVGYMFQLAKDIASLVAQDCVNSHPSPQMQPYANDIIRQFQKIHGKLKIDGIVGPRTYVAIDDVLSNFPNLVRPMDACVVKRYGLNAIRRARLEVDPNAFVYTAGQSPMTGAALNYRYGEYDCGSRPCIPVQPPVNPAADFFDSRGRSYEAQELRDAAKK